MVCLISRPHAQSITKCDIVRPDRFRREEQELQHYQNATAFSNNFLAALSQSLFFHKFLFKNFPRLLIHAINFEGELTYRTSARFQSRSDWGYSLSKRMRPGKRHFCLRALFLPEHGSVAVQSCVVLAIKINTSFILKLFTLFADEINRQLPHCGRL